VRRLLRISNLRLTCPKWRCHFAGMHDKSFMNNTVRRSMSSSECRRREVTARMWRAAEDCSRSEWRRPEKLGRRRNWESITGNRQLVRRRGTQTPSKLRLCWMMKFIGEIWRCQEVKTFINKNGQLERSLRTQWRNSNTSRWPASWPI